jgi:hypothetical protein
VRGHPQKMNQDINKEVDIPSSISPLLRVPVRNVTYHETYSSSSAAVTLMHMP